MIWKVPFSIRLIRPSFPRILWPSLSHWMLGVGLPMMWQCSWAVVPGANVWLAGPWRMMGGTRSEGAAGTGGKWDYTLWVVASCHWRNTIIFWLSTQRRLCATTATVDGRLYRPIAQLWDHAFAYVPEGQSHTSKSLRETESSEKKDGNTSNLFHCLEHNQHNRNRKSCQSHNVNINDFKINYIISVDMDRFHVFHLPPPLELMSYF